MTTLSFPQLENRKILYKKKFFIKEKIFENIQYYSKPLEYNQYCWKVAQYPKDLFIYNLKTCKKLKKKSFCK